MLKYKMRLMAMLMTVLLSAISMVSADTWHLGKDQGWKAVSAEGKDKFLLANPNAFLIDDCDANIAKFHHRSGKVFTFPQSWNEARSCIGQEVELLKIALEDFTYSPLQIPTYVPEAVYV